MEPGAAADPRAYCQFGPLHTTLLRPFLALDEDGARSSRYLSLLAGVLVFVPFLRLARRLVGDAAAEVAAFALAVSPLHIQLSTTGASEALYLLLVVAALERLLAAVDLTSARWGGFLVAGALASLAAVTRYDAWLMWPAAALAAAMVTPAERRRALLPRLALFLALAALLPLGWMVWSGVTAGDPLFFARHISGDHARLGAAAVERYGAAAARGRQLGIWLLAFGAAMTPLLLLGAARALRAWRGLSPAQIVVVVTALAPPLVYLVQGLVSLRFEPLPRFALIPGALLLPLGAKGLLASVDGARARRWIAATALAGSAVVLTVAWAGRPRVWAGAESLGPLTRLDAEDRRLAVYLRDHRRPDEEIMIDPLAVSFMDIAVTHASGTPAARSVTLVQTRQPGRTVADTLAATGTRWLAAHDQSWARRLGADWPAGAVRIGGWRLLHVAGSGS
jgi:4-amino-4-deoxy-L-arabinose transferase-like glycosyltransferase